MPELIPFRWPAEWKDASHLELLKGTPFNCLAGEAPPPFPVGGLPFVKLDPEHPPDGIALREGVWPRVLLSIKKEGADAGPTGGPWVDSNASVVRLAQIMEPGKTVWLTHTPPGGKEIVPLDAFVKPVAEAEAFGAHWVVALDKFFREQLETRNEKALAQWKRMVAAVRWFESRREWRTWQPATPLAVVSTFEGEDKMLSEEFLNLAPRRYLTYRAVRASNVAQAAFQQQKAILYLESEPPQGAVRTRLLAFAQAGGTLIAPMGTVNTPPEETRQQHNIRRHGEGRVIMPVEKWTDPFTLVDQVHVLLSHREDPIHVWNAADLDTYYLAGPKDDRAVAHLIPYASARTPQIVIGFKKPYRTARVLTLDSERTVRPVKGQMGIEIPVDPFTDYAAVTLEA
jgi:hypothetical protein